MWHSFNRHIWEYLILLLVGSAFVVGFITVSPNIQAQTGLAVALGAFYVIWGVLHHLLDRNLTTKITIEYAAIAALAAVILIGLLLQT